jgi:hypothetical protein
LLAGDDEEAAEILEHEITTAQRAEAFDRIVVPTLVRARRDQLHGDISSGEEQLVLDAVLTIVRHSVEVPDPQEHPEPQSPPRRILSVPARAPADDVALEMLSQLLGTAWTLERLTTATLASELLAAIDRSAPDVLCIAALPPGGFGHIRYLCKRVHQEYSLLPIWILRADVDADPVKTVSQLVGDGAQQVTTSFTGAPMQLSQLIFPPVQHVTEDNAVTNPSLKKTDTVVGLARVVANY